MQYLWMIRNHAMFANIDTVFKTKQICNSSFRTLAQSHGYDESDVFITLNKLLNYRMRD